MSVSRRTCYDPHEIPDLLKNALRGMSWRTWKGHNYGYRITYGKTAGPEGMFIRCQRVDCEVCGPEKRRRSAEKSRTGFAGRGLLYLTLVLPTENARAAVSKQVRENHGIGWYIPIQGAFALVSNVPVRSKSQSPYSVGISDAEVKAMFDSLLDMWWPDTGRMRRVKWPSVAISSSREDLRPKKEPRTEIGFTNAKLPKRLDEFRIEYVEYWGRIAISPGWSGPDLYQAFQDCNFNARANNVDFELLLEIFGPEATRQEDTG